MADQQTESRSNSGMEPDQIALTRSTSRLRQENGEVVSWLVLMAGLVAAALLAGVVMTTTITDLATNVITSAESASAAPGAPEPITTTGPQPTSTPDPDPGDLPIRTRHCSLTVRASGNALGLGAGATTSAEVIIEELEDGTQLVTFAADVGVTGGTKAAAGAGITINDVTVGAYASAYAGATGLVGGGVQYELAPGETLEDLFTGLAVSSNSVTGGVAGGINYFFPETIPTAPPVDTIFVDLEGWGKTGIKGDAGIGWVSAGAAATGEAVINQTYATHSDNTYSATTSYSGVLSSGLDVTGAIPFFAWGSDGVAATAQGSISVETIYNSELQPIEMIVTTAYGYDVDGINGPTDNPTITTQQWTLDLEQPGVRDAVQLLETLQPTAAGLPQLPADAWQTIADNAVSAGTTTQQLSSSGINIAVEAHAIVAGVNAGINGTCTELQ